VQTYWPHIRNVYSDFVGLGSRCKGVGYNLTHRYSSQRCINEPLKYVAGTSCVKYVAGISCGRLTLKWKQKWIMHQCIPLLYLPTEIKLYCKSWYSISFLTSRTAETEMELPWNTEITSVYQCDLEKSTNNAYVRDRTSILEHSTPAFCHTTPSTQLVSSCRTSINIYQPNQTKLDELQERCW